MDYRIPRESPPAMEFKVPSSARRNRRFAIRDYIETLDAENDCELIAYLLSCYELPWDTTRSLEQALFRVFGLAKGTPLLIRTGEFIRRTQKRYDDTVLILAEILENGMDHPRGKLALSRVNQQHRRYQIPNDEYLYTLSTFLFEPIRWNEKYAWRKLTDHEIAASYAYWMKMGKLMGIQDLPDSYEAFERFNRAYEQSNFKYSEDNHRLAVATRNLLLGWIFPKWMWPLFSPVIHAMIDPPLLNAVGLSNPPNWFRTLVQGTVKLRGKLIRWCPPRRRPKLLTEGKLRTYPRGYAVAELGADRG